MANTDLLFWNVDTQVDFIEPDGKLYVEGAELLKPTWQQLTNLAYKKNIKLVNTADYHYKSSVELSDTPNFATTFPEHCMANTKGADFIAETNPKDACFFDWDKTYLSLNEAAQKRNIVIRKDAFDVFKGNQYTEDILGILSPKTVIVYGVTTNVCVNDAVVGLAHRVEKVYVIEDAIKELPNLPLPFEKWEKLGVELIQFEALKKIL